MAPQGWGACRPCHYTKGPMAPSCHDCHKAGGWHLPLFSLCAKALSAVCLKGLKDFKGFKVLSGPVGLVVPVVLAAIAALSQTPPPNGTSPNLGEEDLGEEDLGGATKA